VGFDKKGLPIGAQFLGPDYSEGLLLRIGRAFEKVTANEEWRNRRPSLLPAND